MLESRKFKLGLLGIGLLATLIAISQEWTSEYFTHLLADVTAVVLGVILYDQLKDKEEEIQLIETNWNLLFYVYREMMDCLGNIETQLVSAHGISESEVKSKLFEIRPLFENLVEMYSDIDEIFPKHIKDRFSQYKIRIRSQYKLMEYDSHFEEFQLLSIQIAYDRLLSEARQMKEFVSEEKEKIMSYVT